MKENEFNNIPIDVGIYQFRENIYTICNQSNLPLCILEMVLKDLHSEINKKSLLQLQENINKIKNKSEENQNKTENNL